MSDEIKLEIGSFNTLITNFPYQNFQRLNVDTSNFAESLITYGCCPRMSDECDIFTAEFETSVKHAFSVDEFIQLAKADQSHIIVQHGFSAQHKEYINTPLFKTETTLFANTDVDGVILSSAELRSVLSGKINNWEQLGINNGGGIQIFRNVPNDKTASYNINQKFKELLGRLSLKDTKIVNITEVDGYDKLKEITTNTKGSLAIGLRGVSTRGLSVLKVRDTDILKNAVTISFNNKKDAHEPINSFIKSFTSKMDDDALDILNNTYLE